MAKKGKKSIIFISLLFLCMLAGCGGIGPVPPTPTHVSTTTPTSSNPYPPHTGRLVLNDPLTGNSRGYAWDETTIGSASCGFSQGAYHIKETAQGEIVCNPEAKNLFLSNLTFEVRLTMIQGSFEGIAFRFNPNTTGYTFFIDTRVGTYALSAANGTTTPFRPMLTGASKAIIKGLQQANLLAVVAAGSMIALYVNHQLIAQIADTTYRRGQLGILAISTDNQSPTDVAASDARAWML